MRYRQARAAVRVRQIADVFPFGTCLVQRWTWTTPNGMCPWTMAGRRVKPYWATWAQWPGPVIGRHPRRGANTSPSRATSYRSPNGYVYLVTNQGTLGLGRTAFSAAVWEAAAAKPAAIPA